jgi:C-terminal processing protease CtpA/Prc
MEKIDNIPPSDFSVPYGFNVIWQDAKLIVVTLVEGSPAFNAGLQLGDQILSLNGIDYSQVQEDQYCNIFLNGLIDEEVKEIDLVYKSDTITKQVTLHLN